MIAKFFTILTFFTISFSHAEDPLKALHPDFPVIEGRYKMTEVWGISLDQKHNRRVEKGSLVIWRPGFTIWINVWSLKEGEKPKVCLVAYCQHIYEKINIPGYANKGSSSLLNSNILLTIDCFSG